MDRKISKKKIFKNVLSLILVFQLIANPLLVRVAFAEESQGQGENPTPTPSTQPESPTSPSGQESTPSELTPTPTQESSLATEISPSPTPQSTINTGDADASAEVETIANTHESTISGEITTPEGECPLPEGETSCPNDINIENDNSATVSGSVDSSATTGENQVVGSSSDAAINTGNATASGTIDTEVNTNIISLESTPTPTETLTPSLEPAVVPTPAEGQTLSVKNENEGDVQNEANISAQTGENLIAENLGDVQINTGDALAIANILNLLNTNIVGSNFEILYLNLLAGADGDINLNELWKQILEKQGSDSLYLTGQLANLQILIQNQNQINLENNVDVSAGTGGNQANENGGDAAINTGEATALANVTNIVNTNILGSKFFFWVINILDPETGDLILPRPDRFICQASGELVQEGAPVVFANQNEAEISDQVEALANSGNNEENNNLGENLMTTGNAVARSNSFSLVNLNVLRNNWFFLLINNLGDWTGEIFGWSGPSTVEEPNQESQVFQVGLNEQGQNGDEDSYDATSSSLPLSFQNGNQANIENNIRTTASTGNNEANENQGNTKIQTGKARSSANLFNLVNLNILGGRWFLGLVNIVKGWSGNAIFAYPDVTVGLQSGKNQVVPGEDLEYSLSFKNSGYDEALGTRLNLELPEGISYVGDSSGITPSISGQKIWWDLGTVKVGGEGSFVIKVKINPDFKFEESLSWFSKLIPKAHAAENEKEKNITVNAKISTADPESNGGNNSSSVVTLVYLPPPNSANSVDQRQPVLEISAKNNVNDFVYPGDTVSFEVKVKNTGDVSSHNTRFTQKLYNGAPEDFGTVEIELGTIEPGKEGTLHFGLKLADDGLLPEGAYRTIGKAVGYAPNNNEVSSNEVRTDFNIKAEYKNITSNFFEAKAVEKREEILGVSTGSDGPKKENLLPSVLLFILSSLYLTSWTRRKLLKAEKLGGLK